MTSEEEFEPTPEFHITKGKFLLHLLKSLPGSIKLRRKARKMAKDVQDFPHPVPVPDSREIGILLEKTCEPPHRRIGTPEAHLIEDFIESKFKEAGLESVTKQPLDITLWTANNWKLRVKNESKTNNQFIDFPCFYILNTGFTSPSGVTAPLVYVGEGKPKDFKKRDVKGKIVVGDVSFPTLPHGFLTKVFGSYYISDPTKKIKLGSKTIMTFARLNFPPQSLGGETRRDSIYWQAVDGGAVGIILILKGHPSNTNTHWGPYDGVMKPLPGLYVGKQDGVKLRELVESGDGNGNGNVIGTIILEGTQQPAVAHNIYGILPGQSEDLIMISTHHDSAFKGASEDGTGVAMVLAQLEAWSKVPPSNRPRGLLFVVTAGHLYAGIGAEKFARTHRDGLLKRVLVDINVEHACAIDVEEDPLTYEFILKDELAIGVVFISRNPTLIATAIKVVKDHPIEKLILVPDNFFGTMPIGEAGHFTAQGGVKVIHWIRSPYYLLTAEDTLDKIDREKLGPTAGTIADLVGKLMMIPKDDL